MRVNGIDQGMFLLRTWYTAEDGVYAASIWGLAFYDRMHIGCITIAKSKRGEIKPHDLEQF